MNASKVTISQETRAKLDNPILTKKRKNKLRKELVKEYIRSAKGGMATRQQLIAAAGFDPSSQSYGYRTGNAFIRNMMRAGIISNDGRSHFKKSWTVHDVPVTPTPKQVAKTVMPKDPVVELKEFKIDKITLIDMAKEFAWTRNSDSLREFIDYAKNAIK